MNNELCNIEVSNEDWSNRVLDDFEIIDVRFIQCDFSNARIGLEKKVYFQNTIFQKVDFRSVGQVNVVYDNCQFINCDFRGTQLDNVQTKYFSCVFDKCKINDQKILIKNFQKNTIIGKISDIQFIGSNARLGKPEELYLDISNCKISFFKFIDCDISKIIPPRFSNYVFIRDLKNKIPKADEKLQLDSLPEVDKKTMERKFKHLSGFDTYLFSIDDEIYGNGLEFTKKFFLYLGVDVE